MGTISRKKKRGKTTYTKDTEACNYKVYFQNGDLSDVALSQEGAEESKGERLQ